MARRKGGRRAYATDLTYGKWALIAPLIPEAEPGGRPRKAATRELVDAIFYFLRAGMAWRLLPHDLPPWQTVYYYLRRDRRKRRLSPLLCSGCGGWRGEDQKLGHKPLDRLQPASFYGRFAVQALTAN